jgi:N utilization substance protein A
VKSDFLIALTQLAAERHLPREQVLLAIEVALASAFKKDNPASVQNITVKLNPNTGEVNVYALKTVVETVEDSAREISLSDAQNIKENAVLGDDVAEAEPLPHNASRIAAQTAKQVVLQRLREAERELLYQEFFQHEGDIISGVIEQTDSGRVIVLDLGRAQAVLPYEEQVPTERYRKGQRTKVYVVSVNSGPKGPEILVSRSHRNMLKRLFEIEVPEVYNGVVEIKAIAREAGFRSKVAVTATQPGIDPVGSCIGIRGNRIQSIVNELQGEKIDVVSWDKDPKVFITKALSPSAPTHVDLSLDDLTATVVVPDQQLSLAIGREGQNTRLAARLTGWRLDIKGLTEWEELREARLREAQEKAAGKFGQDTKAEFEDETAAIAAAEAELAGLAEVVTAEDAGATEAATVEAEDALEAPPTPSETPDAAEAALDEDKILEALIQEEEEATREIEAEAEAEAPEEVGAGISVEELESFTLEDVELLDDDHEGPAEEPELMLSMPVLTPDAGKIRFAEDLVDERGGGRRDRKGRQRSGAGGRGRRGGR